MRIKQYMPLCGLCGRDEREEATCSRDDLEPQEVIRLPDKTAGVFNVFFQLGRA